MRNLKPKQIALLHECIAEGLTRPQVAARVERSDDPFPVTKGLMKYHRKKLGLAPHEADKEVSKAAVEVGLSTRVARVEKLAQLAEILFNELVVDKRLWLERIKTIRLGANDYETITELEFNQAEVQEFRALLDDIAKEVGDRRLKVDQTTALLSKMYIGISPDDWDTDNPLVLEE